MRLRSLVQAKRREVEDHLLLLHEDPAYLADMMRESCGIVKHAVVNLGYNLK